MSTNSLFDPAVLATCLSRIGALNAESKPKWGTMSASQMFAHCAEIQDVWNGKELKGTPLFVRLIGPFMKKLVLGDKPYPRNSRTHTQYMMTDPKVFEEEKAHLISAITMFHEARSDTSDFKHGIFGTFTHDEKGLAVFKHLDHHLTQFGV